MKKTLTANISGTVFHMEEDAFDRMNLYLDSIRRQFTGSGGQEEIMSDIESRVAELFQERLDGRREVVSMADVDHVITIMGQPEDYLVTDEDAADAATPQPGSGGPNWSQGATGRKRLFRDPDDKWIGGVLGGVGAYFNVDPLVLRIIYIVLLFLGIGWLIYLILWIVVPVATTAAEKLEMRGEAVNVENIKRVFEEGADRVRTGAQTVTSEAREMGRKYGPQARRGADEFMTFLGDLFRLFFKAIAKVVGVVLLLGGAVLAMGLMVLLLGQFTMAGFPETGEHFSNFHDLAILLLGDHGWANLAWIAVIGFVLAPVAGLIHGGISLLFNLTSPRWFGYTLTSVWVISIIILTASGMRIAADLRYRDVVETRTLLETPADGTITLACPQGGYRSGDRDPTGLGRVRVEANSVELGWAKLDVKQSNDSLFHLVVERRARGRTYKEAGNRADAIHAGWTQLSGNIEFPPSYNFDRGDLFRGQSVRYILEVPVGGSVHFDASVRGMLDDVDNTTDTRDEHMVNKTWTMTQYGLFREGETGRPLDRRSRERRTRQEWTFKYNDQKSTSTRENVTSPDLAGLFLRRL